MISWPELVLMAVVTSLALSNTKRVPPHPRTLPPGALERDEPGQPSGPTIKECLAQGVRAGVFELAPGETVEAAMAEKLVLVEPPPAEGKKD